MAVLRRPNMNTVRYKIDTTNRQSILISIVLLLVVLILTMFTGCAELFHGDPPEDAPSSASAGIPQGLTAATVDAAQNLSKIGSAYTGQWTD
jgi:hypothetical protein